MDFHSNTLNQDLIRLVQALSARVKLPAIKQLILPQINIATDSKYTKFGLLLLEDNSSGFFYRLADVGDNTNQNLLTSLHAQADRLVGMDVATAAQWLDDENDLKIGIGMAAINAISQHVFTKIGYRPAGITPGHSHVERAKRSRHVGMVGYFAPIVKQLVELKIPLTVIELDPTLYQQRDQLTVTGDLTQLADTDYIICTASTLLNHSLEHILSHYANDRFFELIGPTCGCFADPLFARGVDLIGGSQVVDLAATRARIESGEPWSQAVDKFVIEADSYPEFPNLLVQLQQ
ncbi:MAG: DUF364 domain-containing protein [Granulosicoccus sp.]|nr:DUF364 domain-containing protein [Granulosicoccus sp.]